MSDVNGATTAAQVLDHLKNQSSRLDKFETELGRIAEAQKEAKNAGPFIRTGESILTSRGFSFLKFFGVLAGQVTPDEAKVERELHERIKRSHESQGYHREMPNSVIMPFSSDHFCTTHKDAQLAKEIREVVLAGSAGADPQEVARYRQRYDLGTGRTKALSWVDESQGGVLIGPPQFGELIEIFRNNEVFLQAGARALPIPPNGRIHWPRQTGVGTAYWVGTGSNDRSITDSNQTTGDVTLTARKLGMLVKIPNELFRFASISIEQFVREDMARVMALKLDRSLLDAPGSEVEPKGLINYAGITSHTASVTATDGNTFQVEDVAQMIGKVEEQNAVFNTFVMRPLMYTALSTRRADAVTAGDGKGQWLFNMWRELGPQYVDPTRLNMGQLNGYPVFKSTNVANNRTKGSSTNLTYILGGDFSDFLVALSGTMEFAVNTQAEVPFVQDQTWFRGILWCDGAPRHEASFIKCDQLYVA